jgi:hypothetical protein
MIKKINNNVQCDKQKMSNDYSHTTSIKINCTEFVLHKNYSSSDVQQNLIDFSEKKLFKFMNSVTDNQQKQFLVALLKDYIDGNVAIAWKKGVPLYFKVLKDV